MQATFGDSTGAEKGGASGRDIEAQDARRLAENQERNQRDEKTVGGSAGRAQVADKDPKAHDVKRGGQGDHLPNEKPII